MTLRTPTGIRHQINLEIVAGNQVCNIRATCICGELNAPARFGKEKAEEDGRNHIVEFAKKGHPTTKRGKKS